MHVSVMSVRKQSRGALEGRLTQEQREANSGRSARNNHRQTPRGVAVGQKASKNGHCRDENLRS